jgi:hypothetical protein
VRRALTVVASETRVRILEGTAVLADHERCYDRGELAEERVHIELLAESITQRAQARVSSLDAAGAAHAPPPSSGAPPASRPGGPDGVAPSPRPAPDPPSDALN